MGGRPQPVRDARRSHFQLRGASRLPSRHRRLRDGKHAGPERGRVLDVERAADVLGSLRPGLLADETELHRQHGLALGLRLTRQGPDREVSLADAAGSLRPDRRRPALPARSAIADRDLRSGVHRPRSGVRALERHPAAGGRHRVDAALRRQLHRADCSVATSRWCVPATRCGASRCRSSSCGTWAPPLASGSTRTSRQVRAPRASPGRSSRAASRSAARATCRSRAPRLPPRRPATCTARSSTTRSST